MWGDGWPAVKLTSAMAPFKFVFTAAKAFATSAYEEVGVILPAFIPMRMNSNDVHRNIDGSSILLMSPYFVIASRKSLVAGTSAYHGTVGIIPNADTPGISASLALIEW